MSRKNKPQTADALPRLKRHGNATIRVPGSKSLTARAMLLGAFASGQTVLRGALRCDDTLALAGGLRELGLGIEWTDQIMRLHGVAGQLPRGGGVDVGAGGTPARFMMAAAALAGGPVTIDGDARMRQRPVAELVSLLRAIGATCDGESLPLTIDGKAVHGGDLTVATTRSSQTISALLLIAPWLTGGLSLECRLPITSAAYVDLTLGLLRTFGVSAGDQSDTATRRIAIPQSMVIGREIDIEPDASSAIYFAAIAAMHPGLTINIAGLSPNSLQPDVAAINALARAGAVVESSGDGIRITGSPTICGFGDLDASNFPDAALCLAAVAAAGESPSRIYGLGTLPLKESSRIEVMGANLAQAGCGIVAGDNELRIRPMDTRDGVVVVDPAGDHRIAMAMAVLGTHRGGVAVADRACVSKSYPGFWNDLQRLYEA